MRFSVVIITRDAEVYIKDALDSLVFQSRQPDEIIVVDSSSTDGTPDIVRQYSERYPFIKLHNWDGTRGESRNYGVKVAEGDIVAFVDADVIVNALWAEEMLNCFEKENADVVAGREIRLGYSGFTRLKRVGMLYKGADVTYPSVNLAYKKSVFEAIGGFDSWFKEAEEIDLNFRAVDAGYKLVYCEKAIVYHRVRETIVAFVKQAFWYGYGRKELTLRHGKLWSTYDPINMLKVSEEESIWKIIRLVIAFFGYMFCKFTGKASKEQKERLRASRLSSR